MWRWSCKLRALLTQQLVFSTHVEVILYFFFDQFDRSCILHTCGGDPKSCITLFLQNQYSPHMWRWSRIVEGLDSFARVFSTHVEVILLMMVWLHLLKSILHTCGGDPSDLVNRISADTYSPHMWRWSQYCCNKYSSALVFSTHVEVILLMMVWLHLLKSILHTCGGDPLLSTLEIL